MWLAESLSHLVIQKLVLASDKFYFGSWFRLSRCGSGSRIMAIGAKSSPRSSKQPIWFATIIAIDRFYQG
jgi:hypothetical protein